MLKRLLWAQEELDRKRVRYSDMPLFFLFPTFTLLLVRYPHMSLATGQIEEPK